MCHTSIATRTTNGKLPRLLFHTGCYSSDSKRLGLRQALHISATLWLKSEHLFIATTGLSKTHCQPNRVLDVAKLSLTQRDLSTTYPADDLHLKFYLIPDYFLPVKNSCSGVAFCSLSLHYYNRPNLQGTTLFPS